MIEQKLDAKSPVQTVRVTPAAFNRIRQAVDEFRLMLPGGIAEIGAPLVPKPGETLTNCGTIAFVFANALSLHSTEFAARSGDEELTPAHVDAAKERAIHEIQRILNELRKTLNRQGADAS